MFYIVLFLLGAGMTSFFLTPLVRNVAVKIKLFDLPERERKMHEKSTPLLGGLAPFLGFLMVTVILASIRPFFILEKIPLSHLVAIFLGGAVLMVGGYLDDRYRLRPSRQIIFPMLAAVIVVMSGVGIREITNPWGGVFSLVWLNLPFGFTFPSDLLTFLWLMLMMYTTKLLDGLDGLVSGLTLIGSAMILFLATTTQWYQPEVGALAAIAAGAFAGFLVWNFYPARIFLGEGGSTFAGFLLGVLAIISGGKIATTLLVIGVPVLDLFWVVLRRIFWEKKSPASDDRKHLHYRLLEVGFSHRGAVLFFYLVAALFGLLTLVLQSREKLVALGLLVLLVGIGGFWLTLPKKRNLSS
ncbi:undecaprenyl/decaprenyl-phosphate alpha-N-acetylglucosaminyl 1-phosphate transferase [Candidatus Uhrbacteria bacterium]|nr:undecaprenyl/decaprenyl-phosphate alpha-N-acetylglucosaminyl 1-phosphate transferase [Candidatus Uhrbacteria bacterium]